MSCLDCQRRAALLAAIAPAISRLTFTRHGLLDMLALPNAQLLRAAKVENPHRVLRSLEVEVPLNSQCRGTGTALCRHDRDYPAALRQLPSAPAVLYASATIERLRELLTAGTVALVGNRTPTAYARQISRELAHDLAAAGITVVSGMNTGLEGTAHQGALHASGRTIAVMPCGPEIPYPRRHEDMHRGILADGAAISEFPPGFCPPEPWSFIAGQRIIAALADVIVVIEPGGHSCALLTAQIAADLGADVAVVPGRVTDPGGKWTFELLRDGAHPVASAQNVLGLI